jgi:hypothetical protein
MRNFLKIMSVMVCLHLVSSFTASAQKWVKLFDGKTLKGWHILEGGKWEIKDRTLIGSSPLAEKRHGILVSDKVFKDFEVEVKYKSLKGNSGLYFRVDESKDAVGVHGFQAEIDANADAGGLYETGGRAWVVHPTAEQVATWYKPFKWNTMKVRAVGADITVWVNGIKSAEVKNDKGRKEGHIALQLHGNQDMEVQFKSVKIKELK